jgi:hypothetical protein
MHFEKIMNTLYSFAAAVVIFGAWGKLEHKDFGGPALTAGLLTETAIFILYGLTEWRKKEEEPKQSPPLHADGENTKELTSTLKQTNHILNKVFKAE